MNVTMKKTAVAMIVALMLAGCSSSYGDFPSRQSEGQGQTQPTQPVQPEQPIEPSQPTQPVQPEQPAEPSQPTQPVQPEQPSEPEQPSQPSQPKIPPVAERDRVINLEMSDRSMNNMYELNASIVGRSFDLNDYNFEIDIGKLSNDQYGRHKGVFTHPGLIVKDGTGKNQLNYTIVNQPYSFYGALEH